MQASMARDYGSGAPAALAGSQAGASKKPAAASGSQGGASKSSWSTNCRSDYSYKPSGDDDDDLMIEPPKPTSAVSKMPSFTTKQSAASDGSQTNTPVTKAALSKGVNAPFKSPSFTKSQSFIPSLSSKKEGERSDPSSSGAGAISQTGSTKRSLDEELDSDLARAAGMNVIQVEEDKETGDAPDADEGKGRKKLKKWTLALDDVPNHEGSEIEDAEDGPIDVDAPDPIKTARLKNAKGKAGLKVYKPSVQKASANATKNLILQAAHANFRDHQELAQGGGTDDVPKKVKGQ